MRVVEPWTCPSCSHPRTAPFCSQCGEEPLHRNDLTLKDLAVQVSKSLSSLDGRVFRSFKALLTDPGSLTWAYLQGQRKGYWGPAQMFFTANAIFFALQSLTSTNIFSSPLSSHLYSQDWSAFAQHWVTARLASQHRTMADYAPAFDAAVDFNAKALIILMVSVFAPIVAALFRREHRPIGAHVVFALHVYSFVLLLFCLCLLVVEVDLLLGGPGLRTGPLDAILSIFNFGICGLYLFLALGRAYGATGLARLAKSASLTVAVALITVGYRFTIFVLTVLTT